MMKITSALTVEHTVFRALFDQIERALPALRTLAEIRRLAALVEGLLLRHAAAEEDLVVLALDRRPQFRVWGRRFYEQHQEIDARLKEAQTAHRLASSRRFLQGAMQASRAHFAFEERAVFPLLEKAMASPELQKLGRFWVQRGRRAGLSSK